MALCANEINLFDLRPGRALKAYAGTLVLSGLVLVVVLQDLWGALSVAGVVVLSLAPVLAVWSYDVREQGLMGDAGSNAMGAYLGFFIALTMPMPALVVVFVLLLAMNLASERVSYSAFIERTPALSWLDRLGRPRE